MVRKPPKDPLLVWPSRHKGEKICTLYLQRPFLELQLNPLEALKQYARQNSRQCPPFTFLANLSTKLIFFLMITFSCRLVTPLKPVNRFRGHFSDGQNYHCQFLFFNFSFCSNHVGQEILPALSFRGGSLTTGKSPLAFL